MRGDMVTEESFILKNISACMCKPLWYLRVHGWTGG